MLFISLFFLFKIFTDAINCDISQIHISQGLTPNSMTISWVTPDKCVSLVKYGTETDSLYFTPLDIQNAEFSVSCTIL